MHAAVDESRVASSLGVRVRVRVRGLEFGIRS
jgi:hypothetical protein